MDGRKVGLGMVRHGVFPFLECSSRGDRRFSAFCAMVNGKTIEEQYQAFKIFEGRKAVNQEEAAKYYSKLWDRYILDHPELLEVLKKSSGLQDTFGQEGHCCQATELWRIRNAG